MKTVTSTWGGEPAPQQPITSPWAAAPGHAEIEDNSQTAAVYGKPATVVPGPTLDAGVRPDPCATAHPFPVPASSPAVPAPASSVPPPISPVPAPSPAADDHEGTWLYAEDHAPEHMSALDAWLTAPIPRRRGARVVAPGGRRPRPPKAPRRPGLGLTTLVLLSLVAAFFAWVSVEPLWLAIGHGDRGTATVTTCTGTGVGQRCVGEFTAADGQFTVAKVSMLGVGEQARQSGTTVTARMVSSDGRSAYVGGRLSLHLRWIVGLAIVLACGLGIALATGATRLDGRRDRFRAFTISLAGPLLIVIGFLAMTF